MLLNVIGINFFLLFCYCARFGDEEVFFFKVSNCVENMCNSVCTIMVVSRGPDGWRVPD